MAANNIWTNEVENLLEKTRINDPLLAVVVVVAGILLARPILGRAAQEVQV